MKKQKKGRRFVRRVKGTSVPGIVMQVPDELKGPIRTQQPDSVAMLTCPLCGAVRYINQAFLDHLAEVKQVAMTALPDMPRDAVQIGPRHTPCKAIFRMTLLEVDTAEDKPTTDRLAEALSLAGAPKEMIDRAMAGYYDDFKSPIAASIAALVDDARKYGLQDIAQRAMDGEFDATKEESNEWAKSPEGQAIFRELAGGKE